MDGTDALANGFVAPSADPTSGSGRPSSRHPSTGGGRTATSATAGGSSGPAARGPSSLPHIGTFQRSDVLALSREFVQ